MYTAIERRERGILCLAMGERLSLHHFLRSKTVIRSITLTPFGGATFFALFFDEVLVEHGVPPKALM